MALQAVHQGPLRERDGVREAGTRLPLVDNADSWPYASWQTETRLRTAGDSSQWQARLILNPDWITEMRMYVLEYLLNHSFNALAAPSVSQWAQENPTTKQLFGTTVFGHISLQPNAYCSNVCILARDECIRRKNN
jgi:hypothetical protein